MLFEDTALVVPHRTLVRQSDTVAIAISSMWMYYGSINTRQSNFEVSILFELIFLNKSKNVTFSLETVAVDFQNLNFIKARIEMQVDSTLAAFAHFLSISSILNTRMEWRHQM